MKDEVARAREKKRLEGRNKAAEKRPTYQELLDESLDQSFPASDPISPGAAVHAEREVSSERDAVDWQLKPKPPGEAAKPAAKPAARSAAKAAAKPAAKPAAKSAAKPAVRAAAKPAVKGKPPQR